jgi:sulfur-oxidizing protein SoxY
MQAGLSRRILIKGGVVLAALAVLPKAALAAAWPREAFGSTVASGALQALLGNTPVQSTDKIELKVPEIAENGAVVPVTIGTTLADVKSISIVVEKNPRPLAASFEILPGTLPEVSSRIKMGETSDVMAVVETGSGVFSTAKTVKVTIGGCGG